MIRVFVNNSVDIFIFLLYIVIGRLLYLKERKLTQSLEDYLETIYLIIDEKKVARVKDISERMNVKKPSVINALKELQARNLVDHQKYSYVELTEAGDKKAREIYGRHVLLEKFLVNVLGVSERIARVDGCKLEHILSQETLERIEEMTQSKMNQ